MAIMLDLPDRLDAPTAAPSAEVAEATLRRHVDNAWHAYVDGESLASSDTLVRPELTAWVSMTGAWDGHLTVGCTRRAGIGLAAAMLQLQPDEVSEIDVHDAVGELANVLAGNVKSLLPPLTGLSTPRIANGRVWFPGTKPMCRLQARWRDQPVSFAVLHLTLD